MKKTSIIIFVLLILTGIILFSPQILNIETVKNRVVGRITAETGWALETERLQWRWLPLPHFVLTDSSIDRKGISFKLPQTRIYPDWRKIITGRFELGKIVLISPVLDISASNFPSAQKSGNFSVGSLQIKNGRISLPEKLLKLGADSGPPFVLSGINSTITFSENRLNFSYSSSSSLCSMVEADGTLNTTDFKYLINYELAGLDIQKAMPSLLDGKLVPFKSMLGLRGNIKGSKTGGFVIKADGDFPCFAVPPNIDSLFLDCGTASFRIEKDDDNLLIDIAKLQLKNPGVSLSGRIGRLKETGDQVNTTTDGENDSVWLIDLAGEDLDLTAIRKAVMTLWGDHHVAKTVCDIVLGGRARTASYYFKAPVEGFNHIENMTIKADADNALILPPGTNLHLTEASGPIEISKGILTGSGLRASLYKSQGSNGSLLLDLTGNTDAFKLGLDINADISALPQVLIDLVHHDRFRKETRLFTNTEGWANGHLEIGNSLRDIKVNVRVNSMNVRTENTHIPWPIQISGGQLEVAPDKLTWLNARGSLGPHLIDRFSGNVDWRKDLKFSVNSLDASIDSSPFLDALKTAGAIPLIVSENLENIEGPVKLNNLKLRGKFSRPAAWTYSFDLSSNGSRWVSNILPHPILAENLKLKFTQDTLRIENTKLWFLEQPVSVGGELKHKRFTEWQGWLKFNGTVRETLAEWLKTKNLFPEKYFPKLPCTLKDLKIDWNNEKVNLNGTIAAGMGKGDSPTVRINITNDSEKLVINELVFSSKTEIGKLGLEYFKSVKPRLNLNWQGFVSSATIKKLLPYNILRAEHLEGDFSLRLPFNRQSSPFSGWIKTSEYKKPDVPDSEGFTFKKLDVSSNTDGTINIKPSLFAARGSEIEISGTLDVKNDQLNLDLDLKAEKINKEAITGILQSIRKSVDTDGENQTAHPPLQISGRINFQADHFESAVIPDHEKGKNNGQLGSGYVFSPLQGFITFHPEHNYSLNLRSSKVCGLGISGSFHSNPASGENSFTIYTDSASPPLLQETLPCFGIKQDLIEGPFHADINVRGKNGVWTEGNANLYSENGYVKRLGFLSKAFSVINLTDLFQKNTLPDMAKGGFTYSRFDIKSHINENTVIIDNAVLKGSGLNLFTQGNYNLGTNIADLTMMVAPLKTVDAIVTNIPLIGKIAGGADKALISIPVGIKGNLRDPEVTLLPPGAIGQGLVNLITNTLALPFTIFTPLTTNTSQ